MRKHLKTDARVKTIQMKTPLAVIEKFATSHKISKRAAAKRFKWSEVLAKELYENRDKILKRAAQEQQKL
jgi:hypothetical protein